MSDLERAKAEDSRVATGAMPRLEALERLRAEARLVLGPELGRIMAAVREALSFSKQVRAAAAPALELVEGIQREIARVRGQQTRLDDVLGLLRPYRDVPEVARLVTVLEAARALAQAMAAAETAKLALASLAVPDPSALAAAGALGAVEEIERRAKQVVNELVSLLEV